MKNKLSDLNNHLFAQIERLSDEDLGDEEVKKETKRAHAIVAVSDQIVANARVQLNAARLAAEYGGDYRPHLPQIAAKPNGDGK